MLHFFSNECIIINSTKFSNRQCYTKECIRFNYSIFAYLKHEGNSRKIGNKINSHDFRKLKLEVVFIDQKSIHLFIWSSKCIGNLLNRCIEKKLLNKYFEASFISIVNSLTKY